MKIIVYIISLILAVCCGGLIESCFPQEKKPACPTPVVMHNHVHCDDGMGNVFDIGIANFTVMMWNDGMQISSTDDASPFVTYKTKGHCVIGEQ